MTQHVFSLTHVWRRSRGWLWLPSGAVLGMMATAVRCTEQFRSEYFGLAELLYLRDLWLMQGFVGGVSVATLAWVLSSSRRRVLLPVAGLLIVNAGAWLLFVGLTAPVPRATYASVAAQRAHEGWTMPMPPTDTPTIVAGRWFGGWGATSLAAKPVELLGAPAVFLCEFQVVPVKYTGGLPTERESWIVAVLAFIVSCGWWAGIGAIVSAVIRPRRPLEHSGAP